MSVRTEANDAQAKALIDKARNIIVAPEPPERISDNPAWYQCKMCSYHENCHGQKVAEVNCRTCVSLTPLMETNEGLWKCERYGVLVDTEHQRKGCRSHLFIPPLINFAKPINAGDDWVENEGTTGDNQGVKFKNVSADKTDKGCYSSWEIANCDPSMLGNEDIDEIRERFEAKIVEDD